jgi:MFS family permease
VLLGYHLYELTHDPLSLGWLGLAQAVPAIGLVLFGGVVADRFSRQRVALVGRAIYALLCGLLALTSTIGGQSAVLGVYAVGFLIGCASAFITPANQGLETDELPDGNALRGASMLSSAGQACMLLGPVSASFLFGAAGPGITYLALGCGFALSGIILARAVPPRAPHGVERGQSVLARISEGLRYVVSDQILVGSMALDLFAVFFGGATALLPIFASDILHVGPTGFGLLRSAMAIGSLAAMLIAVRHPPKRYAGLVFHCVIAGFGVAIITFAVSTNFILSFVALLLAGMCDGISVVVRRAILRLAAPGAMRGRITAVRMVFISSSNELGDFESGMLAGAIGAVPAVWVGGVITLAVVALTAWRAPKLRKLDLSALEQSSGV